MIQGTSYRYLSSRNIISNTSLIVFTFSISNTGRATTVVLGWLNVPNLDFYFSLYENRDLEATAAGMSNKSQVSIFAFLYVKIVTQGQLCQLLGCTYMFSLFRL